MTWATPYEQTRSVCHPVLAIVSGLHRDVTLFAEQAKYIVLSASCRIHLSCSPLQAGILVHGASQCGFKSVSYMIAQSLASRE